ncbi:MAG: glycoside hydrolase family 2 protein [Acidobacteria bacterium]|nr:glycoside hydrolase family 2 protein [Acidobacteriota bacterium]
MRLVRLLFLVSFLCAAAHAQTNISLDGTWQFRAIAAPEHASAEQWHKANVPGAVQTDLMANSLLADPFTDTNESKAQWVGDTDWRYARDFNVTADVLRNTHVELVFNGLDTLADVTVNGTAVLKADNMFRTWRVDVKKLLHSGTNHIEVNFHSPAKTLTPMIAKLPYVLPGSGYEPLDREKGLYPITPYLRKAGYGFGWDWGPKLVTMGIWKSARLEAWSGARIESVHLQQRSVNANRALVTVTVKVLADRSGDFSGRVSLSNTELRQSTYTNEPDWRIDAGSGELQFDMRIEHPKLWWPNGYGAQNLYELDVNLQDAHGLKLHASKKTGLRSIELLREKDAIGHSFTFVVNGTPVFARGANVIPLDSFPARVTKEKERNLLQQAHDANMNMVRVWGGGYYMPDSFYDDCDELGIMVFHDFMFGGGLSPGDEEFQQNLRIEATQQVERLSDHPSMALWSGNNEVETGWNHWKKWIDFKNSLTPEQREQVWQNYLLQYRDLLKSVVAEYGNGVPYSSSSPTAEFWSESSGDTGGDKHSWKVWSGGVPIERYLTEHPRFMSEFGFQSLPSAQLWLKAVGTEDMNSDAAKEHEKFHNGLQRMSEYLDQYQGKPKDFISRVYLSQVMQAEAMKLGTEHHRFDMPRTMGSLIWQLNDCWPVASWAMIDYSGQPKAVMYYARRFNAPVLVASEMDGSIVRTHIVSDRDEAFEAEIERKLIDLDGKVLADERKPVHVEKNTSTDAGTMDAAAVAGYDPARTVLLLTLREAGKPIAQNAFFFVKPKDMALRTAEIKKDMQRVGAGVYRIRLSASTYMRDVSLDFGEVPARISDNFFDIAPGQTVEITVRSAATLEQLQRSLHLLSMADARE